VDRSGETPSPRLRERAGVRGALATARGTRWWQEAAPHPVAAPCAASDLSPHAGRGNWQRQSHTLISATRY
jgi:hypothetical protein